MAKPHAAVGAHRLLSESRHRGFAMFCGDDDDIVICYATDGGDDDEDLVTEVLNNRHEIVMLIRSGA